LYVAVGPARVVSVLPVRHDRLGTATERSRDRRTCRNELGRRPRPRCQRSVATDRCREGMLPGPDVQRQAGKHGVLAGLPSCAAPTTRQGSCQVGAPRLAASLVPHSREKNTQGPRAISSAVTTARSGSARDAQALIVHQDASGQVRDKAPLALLIARDSPGLQ